MFQLSFQQLHIGKYHSLQHRYASLSVQARLFDEAQTLHLLEKCNHWYQYWTKAIKTRNEKKEIQYQNGIIALDI